MATDDGGAGEEARVMGFFDTRIEAGAALLDERRPGWDRELDLDTLDLSDGERCVLGQLFGTYFGGCSALRLTWRQAVARGFDGRRVDNFASLTTEWRRRIRLARASGGAG